MVRLTTRTALARRAISMLALAGLLLALCSGPALAETLLRKDSKSGGPDSLRSAIHRANATPGEDTIRFDVPGRVDSIVPASPLPAITEAVTIDGYTQAGARPATTDTAAELKIRINGANAGRRANGLRIEASDTTVTGLVINRFKKSGILLDGAAGSDIVGNYIGTDQTGRLDHGNRGAGVRIVDGVGNAVGGDTDPALRNLIAWNRGTGVRVEGASAGNSVVSNQILRNSGLGIDLGAAGVTPNDAAPHPDSDTGANNLQNFPEITSATRSGSTTTVAGTLQSTPGQTYTIQCYLAAPDRSGHGEARALLDQDPDVTTDGGGNAGFTCTSDAPMVGDRVSATATSTTTGDTSEFSGNVTVR